MPDRATHCPGCHGSGIEMSGVTYAGISEYVGCHECGPECPDDCGCRVGPERHESVAPRHPGATQSPDGSPRAAEGLRGAESATGHGVTEYVASLDAEPTPDAARDAVTDAEAAEWAAFPWSQCQYTVVDSEGDEGPCERPATSWRWYQDVEHEDMLDAACDRHENEGGRRMARLLADRERLTDALADEIAQRNMDRSALLSFQDRLTGERDRAIGFATRVEAENARLTEWQTITTRALDTACGVLQEASGLPDDIDDPDCRDEMVLALRPRAEKAEAENARLREGIEALAAEMEADETPPDEERYVLDDYANALLELLAEGGE